MGEIRLVSQIRLDNDYSPVKLGHIGLWCVVSKEMALDTAPPERAVVETAQPVPWGIFGSVPRGIRRGVDGQEPRLIPKVLGREVIGRLRHDPVGRVSHH